MFVRSILLLFYKAVTVMRISSPKNMFIISKLLSQQLSVVIKHDMYVLPTFN